MAIQGMQSPPKATCKSIIRPAYTTLSFIENKGVHVYLGHDMRPAVHRPKSQVHRARTDVELIIEIRLSPIISLLPDPAQYTSTRCPSMYKYLA